jgi:acid phosphatase (class A)
MGCLLLLLLLGADSSMQTPAAPARGPKYINADTFDVVALLPDPPARSSAENELEYDVLKRIGDLAPARDKDWANREIEMTVFVFHDPLGSWFISEKCPLAAKLFKDAASDAKFFSDRAKKHFRRPRPTTRPDFKPRSYESSNSYPSGHSTRGTVWAELLAEMYPEQREALLQRGREIGYHRMIEGVHFPTDVYAGQIVGHAVVQKLLANVGFRAEMDQAKAEMDEVRENATRAKATTQSVSR